MRNSRANKETPRRGVSTETIIPNVETGRRPVFVTSYPLPPLTALRAYAELCKPGISFLAAFTAFAAFSLAARTAGVHSPALAAGAFAAAGVFILACGACALNQYLERQTDALMPRTMHRPLPSGRIAPAHALLFALALIAAGLAVLGGTGGTVPAVLGAAAVLWYDVVYIALKRRTAFAAVPGALAGVIPPAIGWLAGGGRPACEQFIAIALFIYLWQVPHFWLLILRHGDDYTRAGLPSLTEVLGRRQVCRMISVWTGASAVCSLLLAGSFIPVNLLSAAALISASGLIVAAGGRLSRGGGRDPKALFRELNVYMALVLALIIVAKV